MLKRMAVCAHVYVRVSVCVVCVPKLCYGGELFEKASYEPLQLNI